MFHNFNNPDSFYDGFSFGFGRNNFSHNFSGQYRAFPVSAMFSSPRYQANFGGKIFLPSSALDKLSRLNVEYPMMFSITNPQTGKLTNAGVLEFTAEEGHVYLPDWLMKCLGLIPRDFVTVQNVSLMLGSFVKIQPQTADFLDISDHRAVLENALRNFSALTAGDIFTILYNEKQYDIKVLETKPSENGISIVETDLQVDFEAPPGYVEPTYATPTNKAKEPNTPIPNIHHSASMSTTINTAIKEARLQKIAQGGNLSAAAQGGARLSGSKTANKSYAVDLNQDKEEDLSDGEPVELDLPVGQLYFGFSCKNASESNTTNTSEFSGAGQALRTRKKRK
ncbi:hypothetical protein BB561_000278 [Smittium simulii]|uniref:Ubiquitin fusion degradation protein 1 n=1 Tax=Smittium simulii TaxID=133385 RepID=A0A2T9Z017_9FUNG|nr:hypothetical protein BB561_000278 [Smittium simulii]